MNNTIVPPEAIPADPLWAGLDVAKESFVAALCLQRPQGPVTAQVLRKIPVKSFARTKSGVREFLAWADALTHTSDDPLEEQASLRVVMEATGRYSLELAAWLIAERASCAPSIINPASAADFIQSFQVRNKSDKTDACALALFGADRRPAPLEPTSPLHAELRDLSRFRQSLLGLRVSLHNRAGEPCASKDVVRMLQSNIKSLTRQIERIEKKMDQVIAKLPELKADAEHLDTIFGVGWITALDIVAELGDLRRFNHGRQLAAFAGLSPRNFESGTSVRKKPKICKQGSSQVRRILYMPSLTVIRGDNDLADLYERLVKVGKKKKAALAAVMRKLLVLMRAILVSGQPYQRHYVKPCGKLTQKSVIIQEVYS